MILGKPDWTVSGGIKFRTQLLELNRKHKNYYDTPYNSFATVYDSLFGLKWSGGRVPSPADFISMQDLKALIMAYNDMGIGFNFSFTNLLLTEKDLDDRYCNEVLSWLNETKLNGVIVALPLLKDYISKTYKNLKITLSVIVGLNSYEKYNEMCEDSSLQYVVLHPDYNHDYDFLAKLTHPEKIEVMANDRCVYGCPFRKQHYLRLSQNILNQSNNPIIDSVVDLDCGRDTINNQGNCIAYRFGLNRDERNLLTFADLDQLIKGGFKCFKLIGREYTWDSYLARDIDPYLGQYWVRSIVKEVGQGIHI